MSSDNLAKARRLIYELPQIEYLSESRIERFFKKISALKEDPMFHTQRLFGFGGSECGALLRQQFGVFHEAPGDSFKTAEQVVAEKLIRQLPFKATAEARRGTDIEPMTRAVVQRKYGTAPYAEGFEATQSHSRIPAMLGNIDDSLWIGGRRALIDYKSSQEPYSPTPFDYIVQLNHYDAIARSNGVAFDFGAIVGIHGPEPVLQGLAKIAREREKDPDTFDLWVNLLAKDAVPGVSMRNYKVRLNPQLQEVIEGVTSRLWDETVMQGKLLVPSMSTQLPDDVQNSVDHMMGQSAQLIMLQDAVSHRIAENNAQINRLLLGVDPTKLEFTAKHPIEITSRSALDQEAALNALESEGVNLNDVAVPSGGICVKALTEAYSALGGDIDDPALQARKPTPQSIREALAKAEIPVEVFVNKTYAFGKSRKKVKKAEFEQEVQHVGQFIDSAIQEAALMRPSVPDDVDDGSEEQASLTNTAMQISM